jgi:hypothetical protein
MEPSSDKDHLCPTFAKRLCHPVGTLICDEIINDREIDSSQGPNKLQVTSCKLQVTSCKEQVPDSKVISEPGTLNPESGTILVINPKILVLF